MWQTKYALSVPKNLGVVVDFRCSEGDFLTQLPFSMQQVNIFDIQHAIWTSLEGDVYKVNICYGKFEPTIHLSLVCL